MLLCWPTSRPAAEPTRYANQTYAETRFGASGVRIRRRKPKPLLLRSAARIVQGDSPGPVEKETPSNLFAQASSGPPRLAVLPFRTLGPDAVPSYFAAGIVDDIIILLAGVREPVVVSSGSSSLYRDGPFDLRLVGQELGVRYVVSGSARYSSPLTRISVSLAEVESGIVLWAHSYDARDMALFDAQDDIVQRVVNTIIPHIHEFEMRRMRNKRPESMTAYDFVLQARELMFQLDRSAYQEAGTLLQRAITMDPSYSTAHAMLADWFALRVGQGWSPSPEADSIASDRAARDAIAWDSLNARALSLHANTRSFLHRDYEGAIKLLDRAIDIAPNDASSWMWSAGTYAYVDRGAEAVTTRRTGDPSVAARPVCVPLLHRTLPRPLHQRVVRGCRRLGSASDPRGSQIHLQPPVHDRITRRQRPNFHGGGGRAGIAEGAAGISCAFGARATSVPRSRTAQSYCGRAGSGRPTRIGAAEPLRRPADILRLRQRNKL